MIGEFQDRCGVSCLWIVCLFGSDCFALVLKEENEETHCYGVPSVGQNPVAWFNSTGSFNPPNKSVGSQFCPYLLEARPSARALRVRVHEEAHQGALRCAATHRL